jgi:hypothetical protein
MLYKCFWFHEWEAARARGQTIQCVGLNHHFKIVGGPRPASRSPLQRVRGFVSAVVAGAGKTSYRAIIPASM